MSIIPSRRNESPTYLKLFATLMSRLPGIGEDALKLEMANGMQEFARSTHCWRERIKLNLISGQSSYQIQPQSNCADVTYIIAVQVNERLYRPMGAESFDGYSHGTFRVEEDFETIILTPTPEKDSPKGLEVWVGLTPKPDSLDLPDALIDHYYENILDGVLERAYSHPSKPYTNDDKQMFHHRRFRAAITRTRREIRGGKSQSSPPWLFPLQAPGRTKRGSRSYGW